MGLAPYYERDGITVYLGDCLEVLPTLDAVDLVLTDPPYGIGASRKGFANGTRVTQPLFLGDEEWDAEAPDLSFISGMRVPAVVWGGNYFPLPPSRGWLVWDKGTGGNSYADCELAWTNRDGVVRKYFRSWIGANAHDGERYHPTQKPVELMRWCIGFFPEAQTILDPFMGSGTTLVAAKQLGRKAIGIEIEEKWAEVAVKRLEATTPPLFTLPSEKPVQGQMEVPA